MQIGTLRNRIPIRASANFEHKSASERVRAEPPSKRFKSVEISRRHFIVTVSVLESDSLLFTPGAAIHIGGHRSHTHKHRLCGVSFGFKLRASVGVGAHALGLIASFNYALQQWARAYVKLTLYYNVHC